VSEDITAFVGLDVHKESIAIAVAQAGCGAPRFIGTTGRGSVRSRSVVSSGDAY